MARTFRRQRTMQPIADLNVTNMIDLGFTLLIIFMIASTVIQQEQTLPIDLPATSNTNQKPDPNDKSYNVAALKDGTIMFGERKISLRQLSTELTQIANQDSPPVIRVLGDREANWDLMAQVFAELKKHGLRRIEIVTRFEN